MLRPVSDVLETTMLLAKREQEIHSKELSSRVLMGELDNMYKVKLNKNQLYTSHLGIVIGQKQIIS
jgi:hypothetical protein